MNESNDRWPCAYRASSVKRKGTELTRNFCAATIGTHIRYGLDIQNLELEEGAVETVTFARLEHSVRSQGWDMLSELHARDERNCRLRLTEECEKHRDGLGGCWTEPSD